MCRMKHARDSLRKNNDRLKVSGGILDNDLLLRDYEDCADNCEQMRSMLERLKQTYSAIKKQITSPMWTYSNVSSSHFNISVSYSFYADQHVVSQV